MWFKEKFNKNFPSTAGLLGCIILNRCSCFCGTFPVFTLRGNAREIKKHHLRSTGLVKQPMLWPPARQPPTRIHRIKKGTHTHTISGKQTSTGCPSEETLIQDRRQTTTLWWWQVSSIALLWIRLNSALSDRIQLAEGFMFEHTLLHTSVTHRSGCETQSNTIKLLLFTLIKVVFNSMRALSKEQVGFITPRRPLFSEQTAHMAVKSMLLSTAFVLQISFSHYITGWCKRGQWSLSKHVLTWTRMEILCVCDLCKVSDFTDFHTSSTQLKPNAACQLVGYVLLRGG